MGGDTYSKLREQLEKQFRDSPPPTLLNKADALEFAAKYLEANARQLSLVAMLLESMKGISPEPIVAEIKRHAVEPDLQIAAMKAAAGTIRDIALEERVVAARAARDGERTR